LEIAAANLESSAALLEGFAAFLEGLAANLPPPAAIWNLLPQSHLHELPRKNSKTAKNPSPVLSDTLSHPMGEGWGEGFLTLNHQL
jgi:hypothetical protein